MAKASRYCRVAFSRHDFGHVPLAENRDAGLVGKLRLIIYVLVAGGSYRIFDAGEVRHSAGLLRLEKLVGGRVRMDYRFPR